MLGGGDTDHVLKTISKLAASSSSNSIMTIPPLYIKVIIGNDIKSLIVIELDRV